MVRKTYTPKQIIDKLLDAVRDTPYYDLFYTAIYTGLRRSELLVLRWSHIDLDLATLSLVETVRLAQSSEGILAAVGIRPWNAILPSDEVREVLAQVETKVGEVRRLLTRD